MSDNLRQRKGKKASNGPTNTTVTQESNTQTKQSSPIDQLREAHARLVVSAQRTADLHAAWRNQMFRMSLIVIIVTLHQLQKPIQSCITDVKSLNAGRSSDKDLISGLDTIGIIFGYCYYEFLGVVTAFLLFYLLIPRNKTALELNNTPYFISSTLVPVQLGFYFHTKQPVSCVGEGVEELKRNFPAVVIYHTIVTLASWFMASGMNQCEEHVKLVEDSIADFERMDKKMHQKRQLLQKTNKK